MKYTKIFRKRLRLDYRFSHRYNISISKYNPLVGSSYIELSKELDHPRKGLIIIQNIEDKECFKWSIARQLNPVNHQPPGITKAHEGFAKKLNFKNIKVQVKIRDIHKIQNKNSVASALVFFVMKIKLSNSLSKRCCKEKHIDLVLIGEEGKRHYVLIKEFNTFMYDHTLDHGKKHFCIYCLQAFSTEEILKRHIKDCYKISGKQRIIMPKKSEFVQYKNYERKIKSPFIIYVDI